MEDDRFKKKKIYCVYQKTGYANPDGHVIITKALPLFPKDINILPTIGNCDKHGKDPKETNYLHFKCLQETSPVRMAL